MAEVIDYKVTRIQAANETELENHLKDQGAGGWILAALLPDPKSPAFTAVFQRKSTN